MATALITGANRGLGLEFTKQYLKSGWTVVACCRSPNDAAELAALAGESKALRIEPLAVDDATSIAGLGKRLAGVPIDLLLNNAGIYSGSAFKVSATSGDKSQEFGTIDAKAWEMVFRTNTIAPVLIVQALEQNIKNGKSKIVVNITSKMGSLHEMGEGALAYRTSKTALNAAMCVIAHDLARSHITVVNMHPGWVQTDMGGKSARLTAEQSVSSMRQTIDKLSPEDAGKFLNFDGQIIPW